jgi:5-methylcytosine-specific restriction protein B
MGTKDDSCVEMVQFHQNYTYEDFIMGFKPNEDGGFSLEKGKFYNFCNVAKAYPEKKFFFIIDEINRGNLSKIFGELLMLIENNYRGNEHKIDLAYSREAFYVPKNLYIIGMMNTADRSLAMIDYALRRRFSFYEMMPGFDADGFKAYQSQLNSEIFDNFIGAIKQLNEVIAKDDSLGTGFCIGHSYFCNQETFDKQWLENVLEFDIAPMLKEYWFDDAQKYENQVTRLRAILK